MKSTMTMQAHDMWHKFPHFFLYWIVLKSRFNSIDEWIGVINSRHLSDDNLGLVKLVVEFYKKYSVKK